MAIEDSERKISSSRAAVHPMPSNMTSKSSKSIKEINESLHHEIDATKQLPVILDDDSMQYEPDSELIKKPTNDHSFDIGRNRLSKTPKVFGAVLHKPQKSSTLDMRMANSSGLLTHQHKTSRDESSSTKVFGNLELKMPHTRKISQNKLKGI